MYQTKDNFKGFLMAIMLAQSYSHSCLSRTQEGWLPHMDFPNPPLVVVVVALMVVIVVIYNVIVFILVVAVVVLVTVFVIVLKASAHSSARRPLLNTGLIDSN